MTCLNEREWIVGAVFFLLGGSAYAGGSVGDTPEAEIVASIASPQVEALTAIPEPQQYLFRYEMEYLSEPEKPFYAGLDNYYIAPIPQNHQFQGMAASLYADPAPQLRAPHYFTVTQSSEPLLQIVQLPDESSTYVLHPQRRLSLTIDQWSFSATGRVGLTHSHTTGTTLYVRHQF